MWQGNSSSSSSDDNNNDNEDKGIIVKIIVVIIIRYHQCVKERHQNIISHFCTMHTQTQTHSYRHGPVNIIDVYQSDICICIDRYITEWRTNSDHNAWLVNYWTNINGSCEDYEYYPLSPPLAHTLALSLSLSISLSHTHAMTHTLTQTDTDSPSQHRWWEDQLWWNTQQHNTTQHNRKEDGKAILKSKQMRHGTSMYRQNKKKRNTELTHESILQ